MFALPTTEDDVQRDNGVRDTLKACPKIEIVKEYELDNDYNTTMPGMVDMMMLEHPDVQVVVCHFASLSIQADERLLTYSQIDRDNFGIFSGDIDTMIGERMMKTLDGEGLIRATGTYDPDGVSKQFGLCRGDYNDQLNDKKEFEYSITKFTSETIHEYMETH